MLYAVLCYDDEAAVGAWSKEEDQATMDRLAAVEKNLADARRLGPVARLEPTRAAKTLRKRDGAILDGPFAETKEQLLGFFVIDCESEAAAIEAARDLAKANPGLGSYEVRPLMVFHPGGAGIG